VRSACRSVWARKRQPWPLAPQVGEGASMMQLLTVKEAVEDHLGCSVSISNKLRRGTSQALRRNPVAAACSAGAGSSAISLQKQTLSSRLIAASKIVARKEGFAHTGRCRIIEGLLRRLAG